MAELKTIEVPVKGMDCAECTQHVQHAIAGLAGVESVNVLLASEKAVIRLDPARVEMPAIRKAVSDAGYSVPENQGAETESAQRTTSDFTNRILALFAVVFGFVLFVVVVGEWLGLFEIATQYIPFWLGAGLVVVAGFPIFRNVIRNALHRQITSHMLMSLGVLAALAVGQWATAMVVVCFMYVGEYVEAFTTERARRAVKNLTALAPQTARVERNDQEMELPIAEVRVGDTVIVRPGDKIPVDGQVIEGQATVNQSAITGESMPVEVGAGANVFAATIAQLGSLRIRTTHIGADTTFGHVIKLVEEAEANRADVQRFADKFTTYYLPIVAGIAAITFLISRDPLATAAVLVVACSCSIALATPIAMLASVGAAAQRGLLIKGGKYLEALARADVVLLDKTGTLTLGKPQITDVVSLNGIGETELLTLAASAERDSEHPLAQAIRTAARERNLVLVTPREFQSVPGMGIRAQVNNKAIVIGNRRLIPGATDSEHAHRLDAQGKTLLFVAVQDELVGVLAASDTLRPEVPEAIKQLRALGVKKIELLTGDNERTASALARQLGVGFRANLLPQDKIAIVREYQKQKHTVVMVGDGVNDAPALAQANVGIAMGAAGSDIALEAAHVALMRDDWLLIPDVFRIAQRTMRVVKMNLAFTGVYNVVGITLAAFGILPPILAAAAQSLPDLGILANSSRLLRQK
ncbi:MAG: cadmium-translocating P-type ATPase [Anaerolineae bacterium]|nr:cadmium-translocating P-type ATPase [Anaerolineae bacterium]